MTSPSSLSDDSFEALDSEVIFPRTFQIFNIFFCLFFQELQALIDEANQSLEESGTPSHEIMVIVLHREFAAGSVGITLAGGADYESKEITVRLHLG